MLRTSIAGQHLCSLQVFSSFSTSSTTKKYTLSLNKRQHHPGSEFLGVFDGTNADSLLWYSKKRMYQDKIRVTADNTATNKNLYEIDGISKYQKVDTIY